MPDDETTVIPDRTRTRAAHLAWSESDDEDDELDDYDESGLWLEALGGAAVPLFGIAAATLIVAVGGGWFWLGQRHQSEDITPPATTSVPVAVRTSTVTISASPGPPTSPNPANTAANAGR